jgi:hypothetical protein
LGELRWESPYEPFHPLIVIDTRITTQVLMRFFGSRTKSSMPPVTTPMMCHRIAEPPLSTHSGGSLGALPKPPRSTQSDLPALGSRSRMGPDVIMREIPEEGGRP